jgi:hypothetical protein
LGLLKFNEQRTGGLLNWTNLDYLFQNAPIIAVEKRTDKPGNAFKNIVFNAPDEIVKF